MLIVVPINFLAQLIAAEWDQRVVYFANRVTTYDLALATLSANTLNIKLKDCDLLFYEG